MGIASNLKVPSPTSDGGWIIPDPIDDDRICVVVPVPNVPGHRAAFMGALFELSKWFNWQRDPDHLALMASAVWKEILQGVALQLDQGLFFACGENVMDVRQKPGEPCILEKTVDMVNWVPFADLRLCAPMLRRNANTGALETSTNGDDWTEIPASTFDPNADSFPDADLPPARDGATDENKCLAARNAAEVLRRTFEELGERLVDEAFTDPLEIVSWASSAISWLFNAVVTAVVWASAAAGLYAAQAQFAGEEWDEENTERVTCILLENATDTDGIVTFDFNAVKAANTAEPGAIYGLINLILQFVGPDGLNAAGGTTSIGAYDCDICGEADFGVFLRQTACLEGSLLEWLGGNHYRATSASCFGHHRVGITASNSDANLCFRVVSWERISGDTINAYRHSNCGTLGDSASGPAPTWDPEDCIHAFGFEGTGNTVFVIEFEVEACP